jgi:hypothetical protein
VAQAAAAFQHVADLSVPGAEGMGHPVLSASERAFVALGVAAHAAGGRLASDVQDRLASVRTTPQRALAITPADLRRPFQQASAAADRALHAVDQARYEQWQQESDRALASYHAAGPPLSGW